MNNSLIEYIASLNINYTVDGNTIHLNDNGLVLLYDEVTKNIEKNGWEKNTRLDMLLEYEKDGIQMLDILDTEWNDPRQQPIWKGLIESRLNLNKRVYARKTKIVELTNEAAKKFFDDNHLAGFRGGGIKLGLYHEGELLQAVLAGKPRFSKRFDIELIRAASKRGTTVVGGLSKLLGQINGSIVSYADRRYSKGKSYISIGYKEEVVAAPNYFYLAPGSDVKMSRNQFQRHKLKGKVEVYNDDWTELEIMRANGYNRIFDCGNLVYSRDRLPTYQEEVKADLSSFF